MTSDPRSRGVWAVAVSLVLSAALGAQEVTPAKPAEAAAASLTGTWVILLEGHQVGLEIEQKEKVLMGTLYIMGQRVPVDGEVVDRAFTLTSDAKVGTHGSTETVPMKITGTHKPDDTLEGEIALARGPMKWTAERLRKP